MGKIGKRSVTAPELAAMADPVDQQLLLLDRSARATRGKRMTKFLSEEVEEDELFWNQDALKEDEIDDGYEEEQEVPDEFDSDFEDEEPEPDDEAEHPVGNRLPLKKRLIFPGKQVAKKKNKKNVLSTLEKGLMAEESLESEKPALAQSQDSAVEPESERIVRKSTRTSVIVRQAERDAIRATLQATMKMTPNTRFTYRRGRAKKQVPIQEDTTPNTSTTPTTSTPPLSTTINPPTFPPLFITTTPPLTTTTTNSPVFPPSFITTSNPTTSTPPLIPTTTQPVSDHPITTTTTPPASSLPSQYQQLPPYPFFTLPFTHPPQYPSLYTFPPYLPSTYYHHPLVQSFPAPPTQSSPNPPTQSLLVTPPQESQEKPNLSKGKKLIEPLGKGFSDQTAIRSLKVIIKNKFDAPYLSWKKIPIAVRDKWFQEFEKSYFWLSSHHHIIRANFEKRCAARLKDILGDIRDAEEKPNWLTETVWSGLRTQWSTPEYVNKREQYKKNRASDCGGLGTALHTGGSISHTEHSKRMKKLMGRDPSLSELFIATHQRKKDKAWVDPRSEHIFNKFMRLHEQESSQDSTSEPPQSEFQMWTQAVGGVKKGSIYGLGSEGHVLAATHQGQYSGSSSLDEHIEKIVNQKVASITTQIQSQLEQSQQMINQLQQQLNSRPSQDQHIPQLFVRVESEDEDTEDEDNEQ